ncbi:MAG TPA: hypothetical protein VFV47_09735 [Hyphomicrobiaceae bacterium]|nr:hypothetical protein [Hyphomicrobiaceae bacterium]
MRRKTWVSWTVRCTLLVLAVLPVGYCNLPLRSFARLTILVEDQGGRKVTEDISATYLDKAGATIRVIDARTPDTFDNRLYWWAAASDHERHARPEAALSAVAVRVAATGCETKTVPVILQRTYEPAGLTAHGARSARFMYSFSANVALTCR